MPESLGYSSVILIAKALWDTALCSPALGGNACCQHSVVLRLFMEILWICGIMERMCSPEAVL